ncbi:kelch domain-containing protein 8A isoform X1 [Ursus arctos]|uniref:kelch domain-containing protein 8A isoform X1 n=1 Tax=Ursus arctos TaxID=9644 RepID=UPI000E6E07D3|nr:kelch domain-containing protein 8A isoform X1 [Ursus arctos]XP_057171131.1 kelch domain-containing protein 8A isoform X1 [Ursus arctos]
MEVPNVKDFQWKRLAPLPSCRVYCSLLESGGQVYAIGGCDDNGIPMDCFEVYSPEADQWTALPPLPTARAGVAAIALGKRIMVIGGVGTSQLPLKVVEMYNIDEGKWKKRSVLREAAMGISVTAKDYRVYAAGGMGLDLRPHNHLQHYDMLKDMWVSLAPMPTPRYAATSFLRGSKIYVLGGRQSKYAVNAFEVFDIETRSWTKFPNIPCKRAFSSFVTLDDRLYSLGGLRQGRLYRQPKFLRTMDVFDMEQGGWLKMERSFFLKKRRADFVAGSLSGRVIVAGGLGNQPTVLETAEAFHPAKNSSAQVGGSLGMEDGEGLQGVPNPSSLPWSTSLPHLAVTCRPALALICSARIDLGAGAAELEEKSGSNGRVQVSSLGQEEPMPLGPLIRMR